MADLGAMLAPDLRKRIEIMADHIARNGSDFETTVKQKNASNPQFSFLYSGEGAEYYQQVLARHRGTQVPAAAPPAPPAAPTAPMLAPTNPQPPPAPPAPPAPVQQTAHMSMAGMGAQLSAPSAPTAGSLATLLRGGQVQGAPPVELADVLRRWKEPQVLALTPEVERQLHGVLASLEHMASRDAIKSGRLWIECNSALAPHIAGHIMVRVSFLSTCAHRLHVLYLVHDLLQTEAARKDAHAPLVRAFKPYLPWILRPCYQLALQSPQGDETSRVLRLVQLWVDRGILSAQEAEEVKAITMTQELPGVQPPVAQAAAAALRPITSVPAPPMPGMAGALRPAMHGATVAQCMAPFAGAAMPAVPMLHGYQKQVLAGLQHSGVQTPESVPVGVLASMLAGVSQAQGGRFVRYKPLDPAMTPQALPAMEVPTPQLLAKVEEFYEDLQDEDRRSSSSSSSSRSRSREPRESREYESTRHLGGGFGGFGGFSTMSAVPPPVC